MILRVTDLSSSLTKDQKMCIISSRFLFKLLVLELIIAYTVKKLSDCSIIYGFLIFLPVKVCTISVELLLGMKSISRLDGIWSDFFLRVQNP